ncbi:hypothetical protein BDZ94DRAFT_1305580 [Collybia nuda]|uniref:Uncharacterized protein n=1 Tax=Collybia nuda TaxID=64659 RepID=A0A9P5YDW7_9AGAR|nr:hypothetical protein BDZ94DRAFT_1305580 [Collybia nuda]
MEGIELFELVKHSKLAIIFLTGNLQLGQELSFWQRGYLVKKEAQTQVNIAFLSSVAPKERIGHGVLINTPTASRILSAFNRDLESLTPHAWMTIRLTVLEEVLVITKRRKYEETCLLCHKHVLGLRDHMTTK